MTFLFYEVSLVGDFEHGVPLVGGEGGGAEAGRGGVCPITAYVPYHVLSPSLDSI